MRVKKAVCTEIRKLEIQTHDIPDELGPYEILVQTACSVISIGTELAVYSGSHIGYSIPNAPFPKLPWSAGYASAGTVKAVGEKVEEFSVNDRVAIIAPHADRTVCDIRKTIVRPLPSNVRFEEGALARMAGISLLGVLQARLVIGEAVVVYGLGLIGLFAALLSKIHGARPVIGVDLFDKRVMIAARHGIQGIHPSDNDVGQQIEEHNFGQRPDVVIESTGNAELISDALKIVTDAGRFVELGSPREKSEIDVYATLHRNGVWFTGVHDRLAPMTPLYPHLRSRPQNLDLILRLFADGSLKSDGIITHRIKPKDIQDTYEGILEHPEKYLGIMIDWESDQ